MMKCLPTASSNKQCGMALLEILVAMLVFALAILPLVRLQVLSMDATKAGYFKTETAAAAQSVMDYLTTDRKGIFEGKWNHVVVTSGQKCSEGTDERTQIACRILNGDSGSDIHAQGNAVLCVFGKQDSAPTVGSGSSLNLDQYLISIRAIWYSGKRQKSKDGHEFYNEDITAEDCGAGIDDKDGMKASTIRNENIDSIRIDMAY